MSFKSFLFKSMGVGLNTISYVHPPLAGKLAFSLFAKPPKPNVRPKEKIFLDRADRLDINWRGLNVPVYSWGPMDAPVVFCAYGWGYNAGRWRHYVPALNKAGYRVVAFDAPGHGLADSGSLDYPKYVDIEETILRKLGGCELALTHSFGGGCLVEALKNLPPGLRPKRAAFLGVFSEVRWIFVIYANALGLRPIVYHRMVDHIEEQTNRKLDDFDVARNGRALSDMDILVAHDPEDTVTSFRNAERNHSHWVGSHLYAPDKTGHHFGTAEATRNVLTFLTEGTLPPGTTTNAGDLTPLPSVVSKHDLSRSGGMSDYYT